MKELFLAIMTRLTTEVPAINHVDFNLGQLLREPLPPIDTNTALIGFQDADSLDFGLHLQKDIQLITVTLAFRVFERTNNLAPDQFRQIGLAHLDTLDAVRWALHGLTGSNFSSLGHRGVTQAERGDLRVYVLSFGTVVEATRPEDQQQYIPWNEAGGQNAGPELCLKSNDNPLANATD